MNLWVSLFSTGGLKGEILFKLYIILSESLKEKKKVKIIIINCRKNSGACIKMLVNLSIKVDIALLIIWFKARVICLMLDSVAKNLGKALTRGPATSVVPT